MLEEEREDMSRFLTNPALVPTSWPQDNKGISLINVIYFKVWPYLQVWPLVWFNIRVKSYNGGVF